MLIDRREFLICCGNYALDMDLNVSFHHYCWCVMQGGESLGPEIYSTAATLPTIIMEMNACWA